jgi:hypothetical protein
MPISKRIDNPTGQIGIWRIDGSELETYLQLFPAEMEGEKAKHPSHIIAAQGFEIAHFRNARIRTAIRKR